ncbi:hypothetical protein ACN47E_006387 [Coniothyrium glycines]
MSAPPTIPPRPTRAHNSAATAPSASLDAPRVPPRPNRTIERSVSPNRYARSPLNDPTYAHGGPPPKDDRRLSTEVPSRPPSVSMPSLGEEGNEYASFEDLSKTLTNDSLHLSGSPKTSNVAGDLPLHAPTASAEAAGFGKQLSVDDRVTQSSSKSGHSGSSIGSRPSSIYNDKDQHGIPEIGVQVPMFRNAGDVQAPSPSPYAQQGSSGIGFNQKQGPRHHGRTKSGREIFHGPPGSYGMHGHGKISKDEFEQKWYEKHPDDLKREKAGEYGPHIQENRKDYHWGADNLDKLVHTRSQDIGFGTSRDAIGTPDEQIGYMASEEFASRLASPRPQSSGRPASIKGSAGYVDSPLRNEAGQEVNDQGEVIHIDPPAHRRDKVHGGGYDPPTEDLGHHGGNTSERGGYVTERGYGTPILASDEVQKHPDAEWRQPAVSPEMERHGNEYTVNEDGTPAYITKVRSHSRSSSRNNSAPQRVVPSPGHFDRSGTPLESHKEYEPLFPEDEEPRKPRTQTDKLKRPSIARHSFPSQDVWEDTPGSLQLETTVDTPEPQELEEPSGNSGQEVVNPAKVFESPDTEEQRKTTITSQDQQSFLPEHTRRFAVENKLLGKVRHETPVRPNMQQRFPSQDIWEDSPSYGHLETTVSTPQTEDTNEYAEDSPVDAKPQVPARPSVPARPAKEASPVDKKAPIIPDRPKPQLPARPSKPSTGSSEKEATTNARGIGENDAPQAKAKPPVPARPAGSKIAALQAGFLQDLNSKLGLGPQAPKKEPEPEQQEEAAAPLQDARKGRAKGPQRRKPASSSIPAVATITAEVAVPQQNLQIGTVTTIWNIGESGNLEVPAAQLAAKLQASLLAPVRPSEPALAPSNLEKPDATEHIVNRAPDAETHDTGLTKTNTQDSDVSSTLASTAEKVAPTLPSASQASSSIQTTASQASAAVQPAVSKAAETVQPVVAQVQETIEPAVNKTRETLEPALSKTQETVGPAVAKVQETVQPIVSTASAAIQSDEPLIRDEAPLVTEHTPGSVDAPGAFPGSGPDLDDETDKNHPAAASTENTVAAESESGGAAKEGAGFTQTFAG